MQFVHAQQAHPFAAVDAATQKAVDAFGEKLAAWSARVSEAKRDLKSFLDGKLHVKAKGITSRDSAQMACFGLVFERNPGPGFMRAPKEIAESVQRQGIRGEVYFPDIAHPTGSEVMKRLNAISKANTDRPLLNGIPGLRALAIENDRLVLSSVASIDGKTVVLAAKSAVAPTAKLESAAVSKPEIKANEFLERVAEVSRQRLDAATPAAPTIAPSRPRP